MPPKLAEIVEEFRTAPRDVVLEMLLEYSDAVPPLPPAPAVKCAEDAARIASHNSPEVWEAQQGILKAEQALRIAKMDFLPDVNVLGGWANQNAAPSIQDNIGYAGVSVNYMFWGWGKRKQVWHQRQALIDLHLDDVHVVHRGGRRSEYREEDGARVMKQSEITVRVNLNRGSAQATVWTCDLSYDYVKINAEYTT